MIIVEPGDLVISGINVSKGRLLFITVKSRLPPPFIIPRIVLTSKINIEYFKRFVKASLSYGHLREQVKGGIKTEIKSKNFLPLEINLPDIIAQKNIVSFLIRLKMKWMN